MASIPDEEDIEACVMDIENIIDDIDIIYDCSVPGIVITGREPFGMCVMGYPIPRCEDVGYPILHYSREVEVAGIPLESQETCTIHNKWYDTYVPEPPVKSKNTDVDALKSIQEYLEASITEKDEEGLAKQDYVMFQPPRGDTTTMSDLSSRDIDRNKDIALVLKMVGSLYDIPLHQLYADVGSVACIDCVRCGKHKPQRGALLCFYCGKTNKDTFGVLVQTFRAKYSMM